ncbi:hypothetical protein ACX6XY_13225 [Streptomyces sp. O3]
MAGRGGQVGRWLAGALPPGVPAVAGAVVYGWAHWCFAGPASPPSAVALLGGGALIGAAGLAYLRLVGGSGGVFGAIFLAVGLFLAVAVADRVAVRGEVATCVVREVRTQVQKSFGEGGPSPKTVYRLALDCPGGYPAELKDDRAAAPVGERVRVAYDPERRVAPTVHGETSPWTPALWTAALLALSTLLAAKAGPSDSDAGPRRSRS